MKKSILSLSLLLSIHPFMHAAKPSPETIKRRFAAYHEASKSLQGNSQHDIQVRALIYWKHVVVPQCVEDGDRQACVAILSFLETTKEFLSSLEATTKRFINAPPRSDLHTTRYGWPQWNEWHEIAGDARIYMGAHGATMPQEPKDQDQKAASAKSSKSSKI